MSDIIVNLSRNIEYFIYQLPEQIENLQNLILSYKNLLTENNKLKNENKDLKEKLQNYENIPTIFCEIL